VKFLYEETERGIISREEGLTANHVHLQGVVALKSKLNFNNRTVKTKANNYLRAKYLKAEKEDNLTITFKPLEKGQTFTHLIGYCLKARGNANFLCYTKGLVATDLMKVKQYK
jgi:hypothetical protein